MLGRVSRSDYNQAIKAAIDSTGKPESERQQALVGVLKELNAITRERNKNDEEDVYSKEELMARTKSVLEAMGCSEQKVASCLAAAEAHFEQVLRDADEGVVDQSSMEAIMHMVATRLKLSAKEAKKGLAVQLLSDPSSKGVIKKKAGKNAQVDFSDSGGDASKWVKLEELQHATAESSAVGADEELEAREGELRLHRARQRGR